MIITATMLEKDDTCDKLTFKPENYEDVEVLTKFMKDARNNDYKVAILKIDLPVKRWCTHNSIKIGPIVPRPYGSCQSAICTNCNAWRLFDYYGNPIHGWKTTSLEEFIRESSTNGY